ncbi:MAG: histidinol dehydrogenase, partial [Vicinamibacterales bacterium]
MRIIESSNKRALSALLARDDRDADRAFGRRVATIVERVRRDGDRALRGFARRFDGTTGAIEVTREEMRAAAATVPPDVTRAVQQAAKHIARVAF